MLFPWFLCGALLAAVILLFIKILLYKKSMDKICGELREHLSNESNTPISIDGGDQQIRRFTARLNQLLLLLREQRRQYLNGSRELKQAVTNISHDLRTPLTAICGYLELLEEEEKSPSAARYVRIISARVETMKQLTEELFRYSVIVAAEDDTAKERVILNDMLEESIAGFYAVLKERNINPTVQLPQAKVVRYLNPSILSRALSNLLNNAMKYSDGDLEIVLSETGEITFANTASGLSQVQVGKLFDRFYTVHDAENSTGLGLEITRALVKQMNGTISADYERHRLRIRIQLPDAGDSYQ